MMNRSMDLDLKKYIAVDFAALAKTIDLLGGLHAFVKKDLQQDTDAGAVKGADHPGKFLLVSVIRAEGVVKSPAEPPVVGALLHVPERVALGTDGPGAECLLHGAEGSGAVPGGKGRVDRHDLNGGDPQVLQIGDHGGHAGKGPAAGKGRRHGGGQAFDMQTVDDLVLPGCGRQRALGSVGEQFPYPERRTAAGCHLDSPGLFFP